MADIVDAKTRSRMMSGIRSKDTRPELVLRRALHTVGLRYRLHARELPGKPDLVFPKYRAVIFVHGCFWHRHEGCKFKTVPSTRREFWATKFAANIERDKRNLAALERAGWRVATVWECALNKRSLDDISSKISRWLIESDHGLSVLDIG